MKQLFFRTTTSHIFKIKRTVTKQELPSSNLIKEIRKEYKKVNKKNKVLLLAKALKSGEYKVLHGQEPYVLIQDPNIYYTPVGVFFDICQHILGWYISEIIDQNQQWVFPKWSNKYKEFNYKDGNLTDIRHAVYTVIEDEIGLKRMSAANFDFLGSYSKMSYYQLGQNLEFSLKNKDK